VEFHSLDLLLIYSFKDDRIIRSFFNDYANGKDFLEREEALAYINDLIKISGFDKEIYKEAKASHASSKQRYEDYGMFIRFHDQSIMSIDAKQKD